MNIDDLEYIFKKQIDEGTTMLYFMLEDDGYKLVERHHISELTELLPALQSFQYAGNAGNMPRFIK